MIVLRQCLSMESVLTTIVCETISHTSSLGCTSTVTLGMTSSSLRAKLTTSFPSLVSLFKDVSFPPGFSC